MTDWIQRERVRNRDEAFKRALDFAPSVEELLIRWQGRPPRTFDYNEAVAAIVAQLNKEGVTAWNGDATWCIAHMLKAQFDRWQRAAGAPDGRADSEALEWIAGHVREHEGGLSVLPFMTYWEGHGYHVAADSTAEPIYEGHDFLAAIRAAQGLSRGATP